jgi:hypothetical protein
MANEENLIPIKTESEAREKGRAGGIASGEAKRKKKLMSQIYQDFLNKKFKLDDGSEIEGHEKLANTINKIIEKGDSPAVSLMKEFREAIEGNKVAVDAEVQIVYGDKADEKL